jgi:methionyl-tRNA synthetase
MMNIRECDYTNFTNSKLKENGKLYVNTYKIQVCDDCMNSFETDVKNCCEECDSGKKDECEGCGCYDEWYEDVYYEILKDEECLKEN